MLSEALQRNAKHEPGFQTSRLRFKCAARKWSEIESLASPERFRGCVAASLRL